MDTILTIFRDVHDPRDINARHPLEAMLFIAVAATLCGAKSCVDIADFGAAHFELLSEIVDLPHGPPSHDCFSRVFRLLEPNALAQALEQFSRAMREAYGLGPAKGVIAVDGKSLRRGFNKGRAFMPPMMVSVWDTETRLSITARHAEGGNEVGAILAALKGLALKGCIVTADALHCHPRMAEAVRATGADYAITLRANHGPLYEAAGAAFAKADRAGKLKFHETVERGHGRYERRRASVIAAPDNCPRFPGLTAIARIDSERQAGSAKPETETLFVVLSKKMTPSRALAVKRSHWSIENHLHRQLDVVFFEDDARTRKNYAPQNLGVIRRIALDILRCHPANLSIARKQKRAAWSKEFFFELFAHMR